MDYNYYKSLIGEYINLGRSEERLLGEIGVPSDLELTTEGLIKAIHTIAAAADNSIKKLVELSGLTIKGFADKYMIPYRTAQDWCAGKRTPPEYLPILIGYMLISEI